VIEVTATVRVWADTDQQVDEVLKRLLEPARGVNVSVVESERKAYER
jgi:hypothetical protein